MNNDIFINVKNGTIDFSGGVVTPYSKKILWACINTLIVQGEKNITIVTQKPFKALKALKGKGFTIEIDNSCIWGYNRGLEVDIYIFTHKQYQLF